MHTGTYGALLSESRVHTGGKENARKSSAISLGRERMGTLCAIQLGLISVNQAAWATQQHAAPETRIWGSICCILVYEKRSSILGSLSETD